MITSGLLAVALFGVAACSSDSEGSPSDESAAPASSDVPADTATPGDSAPTSDTTADAAILGGEVTISMALVGDPGNSSVGVVQTFATLGNANGDFVIPPQNSGLGNTGIYPTCDDAPADAPSCLTVGGVDYEFGIGEFEVTVGDYVTFLNTADREGKNPEELYIDTMSPTVWPEYGSISYDADADAGEHYAVAYPEWTNKPFNFGDFRRGARFANALTNGEILSKEESSEGGFDYVTYTVRLSPETESGMYDMSSETPERGTATTGFVLPSNDEWVKAAYYDPAGGGTESYWAYPTGPFDPPNVTVLDPATGDVVNPDDQPLANYNPNDPNSPVDTPGGPAGSAPTWCPEQAGSTCGKVFPAEFPAGMNLPATYEGNVSTVGQALTPSPWGTYDMGGNVVEHTDSLAPQPPGYNFIRDWRYYHGGVANAPAYQVEISAFGYFPGDPQIGRIYPWMGFRVGFIGDPE